MDVVALPTDPPVTYPDPSTPRPSLLEPWKSDDTPNLVVTQQLWIVGFPYGLRGQPLSLWISGTIASDPRFAYDELPILLIDSRTRAGQSCAPVVLC